MKAVKRLSIEDKPGYFLKNMTNVNDFYPEYLLFNKFTITDDLSTMFDINYCEENNRPHIVFNNIECIFKKSAIFSYLIFCETIKKCWISKK